MLPAPGADPRDPGMVRAMFDRLAPRYDLANHVLSGGIDVFWRARAAKIVEKWNARRVLDLATGSGDLALSIQRRLPQAQVTGADISSEMLALARRKGVRTTVVADALGLPFTAGSFDCVTVAFGLRNMADWGAALREMARVLSPGGHLLVLDFSIPRGALRALYRFYLHRCLPRLASILTREKDAYDYLGASIENFPSGEKMRQLMEANGFASTESLPLTGGIATIYTGHKT
ncbi:MAG: bifunctional demethylmenaquinone methyltransferase/2-methoxy-6-polyprenyl-1,4-benzoquinol methylase UbiE [Chthoniobacterales bacterium]